MDSDALFRQKPSSSIPRGVENTAEDANPSELSGTNAARIGTPAWRQFVADEDFQKENRAPIQAEFEQQRQAQRESRQSAVKWGGDNGRLIRRTGSSLEQFNAEEYGDDPEVGMFARKSVWDMDKRKAAAEHQAASLALQDPSFKARELAKKDREAFEAEGSMLQESDPRHVELKQKLIDDDAYQAEKKDLEERAYQAKVRAFQIEQTDPDTHWLNRKQQSVAPTPTELRAEQVQAHQAERARAEQADQSAVVEEKALDSELSNGVTGARSLEIKTRKAEIAQARQMAGEKKAEADAGITGVAAQAKEEVDKPFFGFSDAFSGIWDAVKGLGTTAPAAFYQLTQGLERPDKYSDSAKSAFAAADAYAKEMQAKNAQSGATDVGSAFRDAGGSLGFSLGSMAAAIPASMAGAEAGAAAGAMIGGSGGAVAGGVGAVPGAAAGGGIGGTIGGITAGMAASATAAYRMAGASFLNEAFQTINAESMAKNGRPMNEQEMASAYEALLPIAQNTALWEAGPEAVGNAVTMGAGKIIFGLGKPLMARFMANTAGKVATKAGAAAASLGTELAGETITQVEQSADQEKMQAIAQGQDPNAISADWSAGGVVDAFKEVAPQTLAMMALMGGAGGVMKAGSMAIDRMKNDPAAASPEDLAATVSTELASIDPEAPVPAPEEISKAMLLANPSDGAAGIADAVLIERELAQVSMQDDEAFAQAEEAVAAAKATGDTKAVKAAEEAKAGVQGRAEGVRAVLKIAAGQQLDDLTGAELRSIGAKAGKDGFDPMTAKELKEAGLTTPLIRDGADGSLILTDEALKRIESVSPRARARVKMTEAEAIQKAKQRASQQLSTDTQNGAQGDPAPGSSDGFSPDETNAAVEFDVPTRSGRVIRVQAATAAEAEQEAAAQSEMGDSIIIGQAKRVSPPTTNEGRQPQAKTTPVDQPGQEGNSAGTQGGTQNLAGGTQNATQPGVQVGGSSPGAAVGVNESPVDARQPALSPTNAPQPGKAALIAAKSRFAKAKKKLKDRLVEGKERAATRPEGITINPKQIIDEALGRGMTDKQAAEYFARVLDEEIRHLAQYDAAMILFRSAGSPGDFLPWMESHYAAIWQSDFVATGKDTIIRDIYAKTETGTDARWGAMSDGAKALEAIRMMSQGDAVTEQGKLWSDFSEALKKAIRAALMALRQFADIASPALKSEIQNLENALKTLAGTTKSKPANGGNSQNKPGSGSASDGNGKTSETPSTGTDAGSSGVESVRREAPASPFVAGAKVEFEWKGKTRTGTIRLAKNGALSIFPDENPSVSVGPVAEKNARVIESPKIQGDQINGEWTAFAPESGTIGIPRAMMPQIKAGDRSALVQFLKARGIDYTEETVPAASLKPTQTEFSPAKVAKAKAFEGGNRSILISADNHVLDGHHQWMAELEKGESIPVIRLDAPIRKLLPLAMQMPSATVDGGEILDAPDQQPVSPEAKSADGKSPAGDLSYDDLVRATYAGADARRKFDDLRPVMQRYVMDFHASGIERTSSKAKQWLASKGVVGNVGPDVVEILRNLNLADAIAAEKQAIVELNRRENEAKKPSKPQKSPESNVATPAKPKRAKEDAEREIARSPSLSEADKALLDAMEGLFAAPLPSTRDSEYLSAVNSGDMETAQRMVDEAAKAAGYQDKAWHGSPNEDFTIFQKPEREADEDGFWFSKDREWASKFGPTRLFFIRNQKTWGGDDSVVKKPEDIKSADPVTYDANGNVIPLSQRFNPAKESILYAAALPDIIAEQRAILDRPVGAETDAVDESADAFHDAVRAIGLDPNLVSATSGSRYFNVKPWSEWSDDEQRMIPWEGDTFNVRISGHERQLSGILNHSAPDFDTSVHGVPRKAIDRIIEFFDGAKDENGRVFYFEKVTPARAADAADMQSRENASGSGADSAARGGSSSGLFSSPLPESFSRPVPPDRIGPLVTAATKYLAEGVNTPEALAERLGALAEGKMRPFSQSIWFAFKMAGVEGVAEPDWAGVYGRLDKPSATVDGGEILDAPDQQPVSQEAKSESQPTAKPQKSPESSDAESSPEKITFEEFSAKQSADVDSIMEFMPRQRQQLAFVEALAKVKRVKQQPLDEMLENHAKEWMGDSAGGHQQLYDALVRAGLVEKLKRKRTRNIDTPARRKALRLLHAQDSKLTIINQILGNVGSIQFPPVGVLALIRNQAKARNLTENQMAIQRRWNDFSGFQPKKAFGASFNGKVAQELHGMLFTAEETNTSLDDWAKALEERNGPTTNDEAMLAVMEELDRVAKGRIETEEDPMMRERTPEDERQILAFDEANQYDPNRSDLFPQDMEIGETITLGGEEFTLIAKRDGMATLEDGAKFGTQRVPLDQSLWFDIDNSPFADEEFVAEALVDEAEKQGYESVDEFNDAGTGQAEETSSEEAGAHTGSVPGDRSTSGEGQGKGGNAQVKRPVSKMDIRNADSKELFADDGGFTLASQDTQDGDKIAAERKAKEEAKAAMDAAQGDMFATPSGPTTKPEIPDLPIRAAEMVADFERAKIISDLDAKALGEGAREQGWGKPQSPSTVEKVKNAAKENGWEWNDVLDKVKAQLKLNDDFGKDGDEAQKHIDARRKFETDWEKNHPGWKPAPAKPALSPGKQALKDAFSDMVDGLEAAPLTDTGFYSSKGIPREKRAVFMDVADKLYDEGIRTPDALAAALEEVGGGKLRAYSDAVWSVLRSNYPELPQAGDWAGIYSKISEPTSNDSSSGTSLESDREDAGSPDASGQGGVQSGRGTTRGNGKRVVSDGDRSGNTSLDHLQSDDVPSASERVGGDQQSPEPSSESAGRASASEQSDGSREPDADGVEAYGRGESDTHDGLVIPASAGTVAQGGLESVRDVVGIRKSVPSLKVEQAEDVLFVEKRLLENGETGVLLTNGTGTGKTFSGLGVVKRALDRGERHVIIVAPSDKVVNDWIDTAKAFFGITDIAQLDGIKDNGSANRVVVTTYANFGQNMELVRRPWGLVVTDEAHYLSQAKDGTSTLAQKTFKGLTWHHKDGVFNRVSMEMADELGEMSAIRETIDSNNRLMNRDDTMDQARVAYQEENQKLELRLARLESKVRARREELERVSSAMKKSERPKALFLSATPFAYHFSLDYAEGYLFEHGPEPTSNRYNTPSARSRFFMENFGYRMRYNKLTQHENAAATGILERMFSERLKREGSMRGRMLAVPFDYSRDFVLEESMIGTKIDEIFDLVMSDKRFELLRDSMEIGDYLARRYLLEGLKAKEAVKRIKAHLALGRKVVVFHDYKKGGATNPLRMHRSDQDSLRAYDELRAEVPGFDNLVAILDNLRSPIDVIRSEFPDAGIFNGDVPKLKRRQIVTEFNRSGSDMNVILGQRASAKEGISLHDTDGKHQRVFIDLGIPGRPTDAIQSEGRIIRLGMQSNGIIEYLTTGTNFERYTFAQTIATRASTAENLAMGENARALLQAFSTGYNDAQALKPSAEQGVGGKKADAARESGDPFENAVALYYTNQKKTSKNKAAEGIDYFATPEPLGFKMVEWAGIRPGERVLEPSGGHGAIARFFPDSTTRHAVEPSYELAGRLALNSPDTKIHQIPFEDFDIVNKFDAIVMNPPFGTAGKTAMDHLEKAVRHLKAGGRLVALIPNGGSMAKRFEKWYENVDGMFLAAEIQLPSVTFERAGTSVSARIVILDKVKAEDAKQQVSRDFTSAATAKEFFERLKDSSIPDRPAPSVEKTPAEMMSEILNSGRDAVIPEDKPAGIDGAFSAADFIHTRNGNRVFVAKIDHKLSESEYAAAKSLAKKHGGYYQSYNKGGAIPGFHFPDADSRDGFLGAAGVQDSDQAEEEQDSTDGLRAAELPQPLRASSPEWKAMSTEQRREYLNRKKGGLNASPLPEPQNLATFKKRGRDAFEKSRPLVDNAREQMEAFGSGSMGADPKFANPGMSQSARDQFDIFRVIDSSQREVRKDADTFRLGLEYLDKHPKEVERLIYENAYSDSAQRIEDYQQHAINVYLDRKAKQAKTDKDLEEVGVLAFANIVARREMARAFRMLKDLYATPEERTHAQISDAIFNPSDGVIEQGRSISNPKDREAFIRAAVARRVKEVKKNLKDAYGLKLDEITGKMRDMQLVNSRLEKEVMKLRSVAERDIIKYIRAGASPSAVKAAFGKEGLEMAKALVPKVISDFEAQIGPMIESGMTDEEILQALTESGLHAAALNHDGSVPTPEQIKERMQMLIEKHLGLSRDWEARKPLPSARPKKPKPELTEAELEQAENEAMQRTAKKWFEKLAKSQSDTLSWGAKAQENINEMEALIREHVKNGVTDFREKAEALGATSQQSFVIDKEAIEERRRVEAIKAGRIAERVAAEAARNTPEAIAKRWIDKFSKSQSDTPSWGKGGKLDQEVSALIKKHLKNPIPDFVDQITALGATPDQARVLDAETARERAIIAQIKEGRKLAAAMANPLTSDWNRPEFNDGLKGLRIPFTIADRANVMAAVESIRGLAMGVGSIERLSGDQRTKADAALAKVNAILAKYGTNAEAIFESGKSIGSYRFDPSDVAQVAAVMRVINAMDADWIDKGLEYSYGSMLSGTQTAAVNGIAGVHAVHAATIGRGVELAINSALGMIGKNDPMSAQWGELKYVIRALKPGLKRAWSNMAATWKAQHPMVERDVLAVEVDWDAHLGGALNQTKTGVIAGTKGNIIRMPMRALSAVDDFNKTLFGMAEAAAFAYRLALVDAQNPQSKNYGMKPGDAKFERFIKIQMNTPGSVALKLGVNKAARWIFAEALPGQKDYTGQIKQVRDFGDIVGKGAAALNRFATSTEQTHMAAKFFQALLRMSFFPFQRTPFNIIRQAARYTPNPVSLFIDIPLAVLDNIQVKNEATGKREWGINQKNRQAEIIERMGQQLQGAAAMMILMALGAGEGDEDDDKKTLLITGSQPWSPTRRAEIEARRRAGVEAYRVSWRRKDGTEIAGFSYGRIEPYATAISATIDTLAAYKRGTRAGQDMSGIAANTLGSLVDQSKEKTFMSGLGDLVGMVENLRTSEEYREPLDRKAKQFLAGRVALLVPNIIRQPIREADSNYRERTDSFMTEILYTVVPAGQKPAKVDPYGNEETKRGNSAGRMFDPLDIGTKNDANPIDRMLIRWRDSGKWAKAPNEQDRKPWFPSPITSAEFKHPKTGQNVKMNAEQLAEFRAMAGKRLTAILKREVVNFENPSMLDVEKVKDATSQARSEVKKILAYKYAR